MRLAPILLPFLFFAIAFLVIVGRVLSLMKRARFSVSNTPAGKSVHLETPLGGLDLNPHPDTDPALAAIPLFPNASRSAMPEYEANIQFRGKANRYIGVTYTTDAALAEVFAFYRNALPDWQENQQLQAGHELTHPIAGGDLAVKIRQQGKVTCIQHTVAYHSDTMAAAASQSASALSSFATPIFRKPKSTFADAPGMDNRFGSEEIKPK
jgi:hypothetical protein